jgi:hypothetical protein
MNKRTLPLIKDLIHLSPHNTEHKKRNEEERKMKKRKHFTPTSSFSHLHSLSKHLHYYLHFLLLLLQRIRILQLLLRTLTTSRHLSHHRNIHLPHIMKPHQSNNQSMNPQNQLIFRSKSQISRPWLPILPNKLKIFRRQSRKLTSS